MKSLIAKSSKWMSKKPAAIVTGVGLSAAIPWATYLICHQLATNLPTIPYQHPGKAVIDLAQEANRSEFEFIMSGSLWAMYLGPVFVFCILNSLKKHSTEAVFRSLIATSIYCAAVLLIGFVRFIWTHAFGTSWLLSPTNMISYYGDTPMEVVNYSLAMSVCGGYLLFGSFFLGLLLTNSWLKKQPTISFPPHSNPSSSNAQKLMEKEKPVK